MENLRKCKKQLNDLRLQRFHLWRRVEKVRNRNTEKE